MASHSNPETKTLLQILGAPMTLALPMPTSEAAGGFFATSS